VLVGCSGVLSAIRDAVTSYRTEEAGNIEWFELAVPATADRIREVYEFEQKTSLHFSLDHEKLNTWKRRLRAFSGKHISAHFLNKCFLMRF
jgi:hypothetical protein